MNKEVEIIDQKLPTVAIVGRVNVGKSTLFNKMTEKNKALISVIAGTTRTNNIGVVNWRSKNFTLIDTGGLTFSDDIPLEKEIIEQTKVAIKEADVILFVVDIKEGLLPQEKELSKLLMKHKQKLILVANKADSKKWMDQVFDKEFLKLGLGSPFPVSAVNGGNIGELLEIILKKLNKLPKRPKKVKTIEHIKVALMGKPNVGKSTLFNALVGQEKVITSDLPHTTREPYDILLNYKKQPILFVDTAGIRRKTKVRGLLEKEGIHKSILTIKKVDVVLLLLDASDSISSQDKQLAGLLKENTRSVIIVINKWDTADSNEETFRNQVKKMIHALFPHIRFAPILLVSAKTQYKVHKIFDEIIQAYNARHTEISDNALDKFLNKIVKEHLPSRGKGISFPKLLSLKQLRVDPPMFEVMVKAKTSLHPSYIQYIKNKLREKFNFYATPIAIKITKRKK